MNDRDEPANRPANQSRPPGSSSTSQVQEGMDVLGADGTRLGRVKEVRPYDFLLDRPMERDLYVPFDAVQGVQAHGVLLNIPAGQVDAMNWYSPGLIAGVPDTRDTLTERSTNLHPPGS